MKFKYYPRFFSLIILVIFNIFVTYVSKGNYTCWIFYGISIVIIISLFGSVYMLDDIYVIKYFFFIPINKIDIRDVVKVQIVTVKEIGKLYFYVGKKANEIKENGYYLITKDESKTKINSGYQNENGETLGKYIMQHYKKRNEKFEKYKWTNDWF